MANHKSALKRHRQSVKRRTRNRATRSEIKTLTKKTVAATGKAVLETAANLQSKLDKAARKNVMHWKTVARRVSKLAKLAANQVKA